MERIFNHYVMQEIRERWSSRAISEKPIKKEELMQLFEAARYAPSCFNEQPWRYIYSETTEMRDNMAMLLTDKNREWAGQAPVLSLVLASSKFQHNNKDNRWHMFDTGTSFGYLSLEAQRQGIIVHPMAGFSRTHARELFHISQEFTIIAMLAIGYPSSPDHLPEHHRKNEKPGLRKDLETSVFSGEDLLEHKRKLV